MKSGVGALSTLAFWLASTTISWANDPRAVAARVDAAIEAVLAAESEEDNSGVGFADEADLELRAQLTSQVLVDDSTFLRRVYLKLVGRLPSPSAITAFVLDGDPKKRSSVVDSLLETERYGIHWARYWRDVIFSRAQDPRAERVAPVFERWIARHLNDDTGWDAVAKEIVTATGDVSKNGATGLIVAQQGETVNVAAEVARVFLGMQLQCAQCHDHPYDAWKREQFHELAAFFPRMRLQRVPGEKRSFQVASFNRMRPQRGLLVDDPAKVFERFDANGDAQLARNELPRRLRSRLHRLLRIADRNKDEMLSQEELASIPARRKRPRAEHFMPDLDHPEKRGTLTHPKFFLGEQSPPVNAPDLSRREALASYLTAASNPWFARAFVNRMWTELIGAGFVTPVDDLGPSKQVQLSGALNALTVGFRESGYSPKWLVRTITRTQAFVSRSGSTSPGAADLPVAGATTRLGSDSLLDSLAAAFGMDVDGDAVKLGMSGNRRGQSLRGLFRATFGYDPSTPPDAVLGTLPQALWMMNSRLVNSAVEVRQGSVLQQLLEENADDTAVIGELYLRVLGRQPSTNEVKICTEYLLEVEARREAFEDIYWSLVNTTEFLHHR